MSASSSVAPSDRYVLSNTTQCAWLNEVVLVEHSDNGDSSATHTEGMKRVMKASFCAVVLIGSVVVVDTVVESVDRAHGTETVPEGM